MARDDDLWRLSPHEICKVISAGGSKTFLQAGTAAYGLASGKRYEPGQQLVRADRGGRVLVYWVNFVLTIKTQFLGRMPTTDHLYDVEAAVSFGVEQPDRVYQHLLRAAERLLLKDFSQDVADRMEPVLSRLAQEFAPDTLAGGVGEADAKEFLEQELSRIYAPQGLAACEVCLQCVRKHGDVFQAQLLACQVRAIAERRRLSLEAAYQSCKRELDAAAAAGEKHAKAVVESLSDVKSFAELQADAPRREKRIDIAPNEPRATARTGAILTSTMPLTIGGYLVERIVGRGGMGVVYRAYDRKLRRAVAIKELRPARVMDPDSLERFRREMEATGRLEHENLIRAYHVVEQDGVDYLVMEYVD